RDERSPHDAAFAPIRPIPDRDPGPAHCVAVDTPLDGQVAGSWRVPMTNVRKRRSRKRQGHEPGDPKPEDSGSGDEIHAADRGYACAYSESIGPPLRSSAFPREDSEPLADRGRELEPVAGARRADDDPAAAL